jgi:CAAX prenyl protease-like protein
MLLLGLAPRLALAPRADAGLRVAVLTLVLLAVSRPALSLRVARPLGSALVGAGVFLLWILPDLLVPSWHSHWLFSNRFTGTMAGSIPVEARGDALFLALRAIRGVLLVPVIEELFWRGWLARWIDDPADFQRVPIGRMSRFAFWATVLLFASEHGALWDVGLLAGAAYNLWIRKTGSLGDVIVAHAVTNGLLAMYVVGWGRWEYW